MESIPWFRCASGNVFMHIYAKQSEIMQKIDKKKAQTAKFTVFAMESQLRSAKNMEN